MDTTTTVVTELARIPQETLDVLDARVRAARLPRLVPPAAQAPGPGQSRHQSLLRRWQHGFDWRAIENRIEELGYAETSTVDGRRLAAIHSRAATPTGVPILLIHGWPDSPLRFTELIPLLTAAGHDVVAPAIPGFWRSEEPDAEMSRDIPADDFHALMLQLGYSRYAVHGGDWGSAIAQTMAQQHGEAIVALHLSDVPFDLAYTIDKDTAGPAEVAYLESIERFGQEAMYLTANTMQPNLIATILADTPVGLAAWLGSLYDAWSEKSITDDHIITNAAVMWLTSTVRSSMRLYSEPAMSWDEGGDEAWDPASGQTWDAADDSWGDTSGWEPAPVVVPTAFALFPADLGTAPRELAERHFTVERFTIMPRGGHFAALEEPELLAEDLLEFLTGRQ